MRQYLGFAAIAVVGLVGPFALPTVVSQLAFVWLFVLFALTWARATERLMRERGDECSELPARAVLQSHG